MKRFRIWLADQLNSLAFSLLVVAAKVRGTPQRVRDMAAEAEQVNLRG